MDLHIIVFIAVGFLAQIIDGALGMAYGVTSTSFLLTLGIPPAPASASVHTAEIFASGASGIAHLRFGNVDRQLVKSLLIPGMIGGIVGAYLLSSLPGERIKSLVAVYLLIMGLLIVGKALRKAAPAGSRPRLAPLGLAGGFFDAIGGGGWGPIVTSTLMASGEKPRFAVGSTNLAEFFVTVAQVVTFLLTLGLVHWKIIVGLTIGGVLAAPLAAYVCKRLPARTLMILVGTLVVGLSIRTIVSSFS
jgi:uncharacterized membrane protein YfcA